MKKLFILLLALICIFATVSCGSDKTSDSSDVKGSDSKNTDSSIQCDTQKDTQSDTADTESGSGIVSSTDSDGDNLVPDIPTVDPELQARVDRLLYSKHKLTYNEDGSFRVLILADLHMDTKGNSSHVQAVSQRVKTLVDRVNPNLVILTGDNTIKSSTEEQLRANIDAMISYVEEKKIPWCHVYGNHDFENALSTKDQQKIYESYEYCISKDTENITGTGNYVHAVYKPDGSIGSVIYCVDSGAYSQYGYSYVKDDQIQWYKESAKLLQEYNGGKVINGMMAFHIPMYENRIAYENRTDKNVVSEWNGQKNENICSRKQ